MIQVKVKLLGTLSFLYPAFGKFRIFEVGEGETIKELRQHLGLYKSEAIFTSVNAKMVGDEYIMFENDEIIFFPAVSGG
jgi:molybdopterin synthase sulfur carrier subunit